MPFVSIDAIANGVGIRRSPRRCHCSCGWYLWRSPNRHTARQAGTGSAMCPAKATPGKWHEWN